MQGYILNAMKWEGMEHMSKNEQAVKRSKRPILIFSGIIILIVIGFALFVLLSGKSEPDAGKIQTELIGDLQLSGYSRTIGKEEFAFYGDIVRRELEDRTDTEEIDRRARAYAGEMNAQFYLAEKLGVMQPFSFEQLQAQMEQENASRARKKERGETFYGPTKFDLTGYYLFTTSNLRLQLTEALADRAGRRTKAGSKEFYEKNIDRYVARDDITYTVWEQGTQDKQTHTVTLSDLRTLEKLDEDLLRILTDYKKGASFAYEKDGVALEGVIDDKVLEYKPYEEIQMIVLQEYIDAELFDPLIEQIAADNPVSFEDGGSSQGAPA